MILGNIFENLIENQKEEICEILYQHGNIKIERILSYGQSSAPNFWYDQKESEFVMLLQGYAELEYEEGERHILTPGHYTLIKPRQKHRVAFTAKDTVTVWLAFFF